MCGLNRELGVTVNSFYAIVNRFHQLIFDTPYFGRRTFPPTP
jgi:hypothetical protein